MKFVYFYHSLDRVNTNVLHKKFGQNPLIYSQDTG